MRDTCHSSLAAAWSNTILSCKVSAGCPSMLFGCAKFKAGTTDQCVHLCPGARTCSNMPRVPKSPTCATVCSYCHSQYATPTACIAYAVGYCGSVPHSSFVCAACSNSGQPQYLKPCCARPDNFMAPSVTEHDESNTLCLRLRLNRSSIQLLVGTTCHRL
jgi:hypothetical protein